MAPQHSRYFYGRKICLLVILFLVVSEQPAKAASDACLACDREMRRTIEALQAWRRLHEGVYPSRLTDLRSSNLLPRAGGICPEVLREMGGAKAAHSEITSRGEGGDPPEMYEYEMSAKLLLSKDQRPYLLVGAPDYSRQQLKAVLLKRPFFDQVPILRCSSHRAAAPANYSQKENARRNAPVTGSIYWSGTEWEQLWLDDVPYCARHANVLFGLKGPPFYIDQAPSIPQALDLRKWSCAFGDHAWWWTYPLFYPQPKWKTAAHLGPFFQGKHGRVLSVAGEEWWINGLVQLQGQLIETGQSDHSGPGMEAFVWKKTGAKVDRKITAASWLQGTVWTAPAGQTTGWLVWNYLDGASEWVPIVYGTNTVRFWGNQAQIKGEQDFLKPVWTDHESEAAVGQDRFLRLYRQEWTNPRPDVLVVSLDFVSNEDCPASPFLVALNTR